MAREMVPLALNWLDEMPPYYRDDPLTQAVLNAQAGEMQRIQDYATLLMASLPDEASGSLLTLWELQTGLPVAPADTTEDIRHQVLRSHISRRVASSEEAWATAMTEAVGSSLWSYEVEPATGTLTIHLPYATTSPAAQRVRVFARAITPAHLTVEFQYGEGFVFDESPFDSGEF